MTTKNAEMPTDADQALIALLRENARASTAELARRLGVSRTTVQSRIERLEARGVITGYGVRLSPGYEQGLVKAHVLLTRSEEHTSELQSRENHVCRRLLEKKNTTDNRGQDLIV